MVWDGQVFKLAWFFYVGLAHRVFVWYRPFVKSNEGCLKVLGFHKVSEH